MSLPRRAAATRESHSSLSYRHCNAAGPSPQSAPYERQGFHSSDRGRTWEVNSTPMHSNAASGIFALAFRNREDGLAVGGDLNAPAASPDAMALTSDGGESAEADWNLSRGHECPVAWLPPGA